MLTGKSGFTVTALFLLFFTLVIASPGHAETNATPTPNMTIPANPTTTIRFVDNGSGTFLDNLTGLIWPKDGNTPAVPSCNPAVPKTWRGAQDYIDCLNQNNFQGFKDWRLPDASEMGSLIYVGRDNSAAWLNTEGFSNVQEGFYWTSTAGSLSLNASAINMRYGFVYPFKKTANNYSVWPVRGGGR